MIRTIRKKFPDYADMPDEQLLGAIHQKHYADMPREKFDQMCGCCRPEHDNLATAAVTGQDSMDLMNMAPEVKPAVKMTFEQFLPIFFKGIPGKVCIVTENGTTYVVDYAATDPVEAMEKIMEGDDSELLGYPAKGDQDAAVTKQGEVVTDLDEMKQHAEAGNVAWAANGNGNDLMEKAQQVSAAIKNRSPHERNGNASVE
jgi:hypothetical protein